MSTLVYEEVQEEQVSSGDWKGLVTDAQYERGQYYSDLYNTRSGEISRNKNLWDRLVELYACQRLPDERDPDYPNNFIPLLTPTVEGQVASIIEADIEFTHVTDNPAHRAFMPKYDAASQYFRRKNKFMLHFKDFTRTYDLLGNCWITPCWENSLTNSSNRPNGFPRLIVPPLLSVMVDGRIKDYKDLQYAEYIIHEIGFQTIGWARKQYGDEKANALTVGYNRYDGENPDISVDDSKSFMLLHVWTRNNPQNNLQLIEMDSAGFILRESDSSKPYYKNVDNEYPFYFCRMIPIVGQFYGYGDGQILKPMQECVNNLVDELELAARFSAQSKILVDPKAKMDGDQINSDPSQPAICVDPNGNVRVLQGGGINPVVVTMIEFLLREAQRATRFSDIMTGNQQGSSATATQINSQMLQGSVGINDKKSDIAQTMEWVDRYCLKLCLEKWDKPFWASLGHNYSQYIDPVELGRAPAVVPLTNAKMNEHLERAKGNSNYRIPTIEEVYDETDELVMSDIDFDTKVIMSSDIPRGKNDQYNILLGLAQMQVLGANGQVQPLITPKRLKELLEQILGFKLQTEGEEVDEFAGTIAPTVSQINPVGAGGTVQTPTAIPSNLMGTVPQTPGGDQRGLIL